MILTAVLTSCENDEVEIIIKNKSNNPINHLIVLIQNKQFTVDKIDVNSYSIINIKKNNILLNKHDFRIETLVYLKEGKTNSGFFYSDLSGVPNSKYLIMVYDSSTLIK